MPRDFLTLYNVLFNNATVELQPAVASVKPSKGLNPALTKAIIAYCRGKIVEEKGPDHKPTNVEIQEYKMSLSKDVIKGIEEELKTKEAPLSEADKKLMLLINAPTLTPYEKSAKDRLEKSKNDLKIYLAKYSADKALGEELFGKDFKLVAQKEAAAGTEKILKEFQELEMRFLYFPKLKANKTPDHITKLYLACYKFCEYHAVFQEDTYSHSEMGKRAYNMMVLFGKGGIHNILTELNNFVNNHLEDSKKPTHDILMYNIPKHGMVFQGQNPPFDLKFWKENFIHIGVNAIKYFSDVEIIESTVKRDIDSGMRVDAVGAVPTTREYFDDVFSRAEYGRKKENPYLAELYRTLKIGQSTFNAALDFLAVKTEKTADNIPEVSINIGKGYYLVKIPHNDPRALVLGHITNCCQSIDGVTSQQVKDGVQLANNGFYGFLKTAKNFNPKEIDWANLEKNGHTIIGTSYAWRSLTGALVLDSLEVLTSFRSSLNLRETLRQFGEAVSQADPTIERVMIGGSGYGQTNEVLAANNLRLGVQEEEQTEASAEAETEDSHKTNMSMVSFVREKMIEGEQCEDSEKQYEAWVSNNISSIRAKLKPYTKVDTSSFTASQIADILAYKDEDTIKALSLEESLKAYSRGFTIQTLAPYGQCSDKILFLTSDNAFKLYDGKYTTLERLGSFDTLKIEALSSDNAFKLYDGKYIDFEDLAQIESAKVILALTIYEAVEAIRDGYKIPDLLTYSADVDLMSILISSSARDLYKAGYTNIEELSKFSCEKIKILTDYRAENIYKTGYASFAEIAQIENLEVLKTILQIRQDFFEGKYCSLKTLVEIPREKMSALTEDDTIYKSKFTTVEELMKFSERKIYALKSGVRLYEGGHTTVEKLAKFDVEKIEFLALGSTGLFDDHWVTVEELGKLEANKIKAIRSANFWKKLRTDYKISFEKLSKFSADAINKLFSYEGIAKLDKGADLLVVAKEMGFMPEESAHNTEYAAQSDLVPLITTGPVNSDQE